MRLRFFAAYVLALGAPITLTAHAASVSFRGLGSLASGSAFESEAAAVSGDGSVVVGYTVVPGNGLEAFRWSEATGMVALGDLAGGSHHSQAYGVNATGTVIVGYSNHNTAFRWTQSSGVMQSLGYFPGGLGLSVAKDVSSFGNLVVGYGISAQSGTNDEGFTWTVQSGLVGQGDFPGGTYDSEVNAVNGAGTVWAGQGHSANGARIARWTNAGGFEDLGAGRAWGVDALGDTIVGHGYVGSAGLPFYWTRAAGLTYLPTLPSPSNTGIAYDVSADGKIVIGYSDSYSGPAGDAFIWDAISGTRSLRDFLTVNGVNSTGWYFDRAYGISYDGSTIVGSAINPSGMREAYAITLPEPSAATMLLLLASPLLTRRHRSQRSKLKREAPKNTVMR